jgi:hypothetical protein
MKKPIWILLTKEEPDKEGLYEVCDTQNTLRLAYWIPPYGVKRGSFVDPTQHTIWQQDVLFWKKS